MANEREYCADVARAEGEPLAGTADVVDAWVMLEYVPAWTAKATSDNALAPAMREWLTTLLGELQSRGAKARLQFVRQPEVDRRSVTFLIATNDGLHRCDASTYMALCDVSLDDVLATPTDARPQFFVCTNGQRDVCCARFGLPTYAALREYVGDRAWQTTHFGGHRFAPNVLALPQAALYGRVQPTDVGAFVAAVERGELPHRWLRGRSRFSPEIQAAEAALRARGITPSAEPKTRAVEGALEVAFGDTVVIVRAGTARPVLASCGDTRKPVAPWLVSDPL